MRRRFFIIVIFTLCFAFGKLPEAFADNVCAICGKEIQGTVYIVTDQVTGEKKLVCSDCIKLPRCSICGLPVKDGGVELPDGRWLCARDAKTVVLDADDAERICADVHDDLDRLFSRFTSFPTNVDVAVIDRVDVNSMFDTAGNSFESPNLLGCIWPTMTNGQTRYEIRLLTGLPEAQLKETCAHELSHAWVGENVSTERHARIARDAEEGFCEMVGYLLMDSQGEEVEEKRVLANHYTRGQVNLFIEAEQQYGFDQILDWMKYGVTSRLEEGHLDEIRDEKTPLVKSAMANPLIYNNNNNVNKPAPAPTTIQLEGILWGSPPAAIINGQSFFDHDQFKINVGETKVTVRCLTIQKDYVLIKILNSGEVQKLNLQNN
jgi:Protein DA1